MKSHSPRFTTETYLLPKFAQGRRPAAELDPVAWSPAQFLRLERTPKRRKSITLPKLRIQESAR